MALSGKPGAQQVGSQQGAPPTRLKRSTFSVPGEVDGKAGEENPNDGRKWGIGPPSVFSEWGAPRYAGDACTTQIVATGGGAAGERVVP